ncbi:hypothetical protein PFICI_04866 [Pestalotiopsis fici W106-1]|uniref:Uncharacterized protein n=1 Tax=Pestalotiopsis fici (strain W106-1 / CGMCC3.15140) TaxID=1229662 RepID=W3XAA7_PESFW|nr:uncharacterized protein PFICI_04866 [Pestalotiopsis fici W106-1]ETS82990.1 hypothetical protein PFICI_04866 [Pestalotiopsis fici W106-1]
MTERTITLLALAVLPWHILSQLTSPTIPVDTGVVLDSQDILGPSFLGSEATPQLLEPKTRFLPEVVGFHQDGGNSRTTDCIGPLGSKPEAGSRSIGISAQFWQNDHHLIARSVCNETQPYFCMAALDPVSLTQLATWAPENQTLFSPYGEVVNGSLVFPTLEGHVFRVQREDSANGTIFRELLDIDLSNILSTGHSPMSTMYDSVGNLWFAATPIPGMGSNDNSSMIGFINPSGAVYTKSVEGQMFENSMAINGRTVYINSGPLTDSGQSNASGYMFAFQADGTAGVETVWTESYSAGSTLKPGGFARGSGSSPTLVGNKYVAITDNADSQVNLVVYRQAEDYEKHSSKGGSSFVCQIPLFKPNASANENAMVSHVDGSTYSVLINNNYGAPAMQNSDVSDNINGDFNSFASLAPGIDRVDISVDGHCTLRWESDIRATSVLSLSTSNGIVYAYTQDDTLALDGQYVWYFTAINFTSGEEIWRARAGAGGNFNNNFSPTQLAPNGMLYQIVTNGIAWLKDAT